MTKDYKPWKNYGSPTGHHYNNQSPLSHRIADDPTAHHVGFEFNNNDDTHYLHGQSEGSDDNYHKIMFDKFPNEQPYHYSHNPKYSTGKLHTARIK